MDGPRSNAAESGMAYIGSIPAVAMEDESVQQQDMNNLIINRSPMKLSRSATTNAALDQVTRSRMERMVPLDKHAAARSATDSYADTRRLSPTSDQVTRNDSTSNAPNHTLGLSPKSNSPPRPSFDSDLWNYYKNRERRLSLPSGDASHIAQSTANENGRTVVLPTRSNTKQFSNSISKLFGSSRQQRKPSISKAFNVQHVNHVTYDESTGRFLGLPAEWEDMLRKESGSERWGALLASSSTPYGERHSISGPGSTVQEEEKMSRDSKRLTLSSIADSLYSYESRYQRPAERPASFPSTISSSRDSLTSPVNLPDSNPAASTTPITPRPLPHPPLP
ncbi:signal transducing kinase of the PAK [Serendipita sp. 401]|nr:signal transducing kinase of the PAK [Serendipita sp. 401]